MYIIFINIRLQKVMEILFFGGRWTTINLNGQISVKENKQVL